MDQNSDVLFSKAGQGHNQVGVITLNRIKALNALSRDMIVKMQQHLDEWSDTDAIRAVLIKSNSDKAFCAGGDVRKLYLMRGQSMSWKTRFFEEEYHLNRTFFHYKKPVVALMDGITMGGGVGISVHGSHRIATERLQWAMPESKIGFFTDVGVSYTLSRCQEMVGYYLGLTGRSIDAATAQDIGLVDHVVASDHLAELEEALCTLEFGEDAHAGVTEVISHFVMPTTVPVLSGYYPTIRCCFNMADVPSIMEALRSQASDWSDQVVQDLEQRSPISLKVIFAMLNRAVNLSFDAVIKQDLIIVSHFMQTDDMYEGIRAMLIDKDNNPRWNPRELGMIEDEVVENYFTPLSVSAH